jgi:hypothetical protein
MKKYTTILFSFMMFALATTFITSCKEDDKPEPDPLDVNTTDTTVTCNAFVKTIEENPTANLVIGTLDGTTNKGSASFSLLTEMPTGAFSVDAISGEVSVKDNSLFTIASNPTLTGTFEVRNAGQSTSCTITITLKDTSSNDLPDCGEDPGYTKVLTGNVDLKTQESVDTFAASGWTEVVGELRIRNSEITDISKLRTLTKVTHLTLERLNNIPNLDGLCNIKEVGVITIKKCNALTSLKGLENVATSGPYLTLESNPLLENIDALEKTDFTSDDPDYGIISIVGNAKLANLNGLKNFKNVYTLDVISNPALIDLKGLEGLMTIGQNLTIELNPGLVSITDLQIKTIGGRLDILENESLTSMDMPALESCGPINIKDNNALEDLSGFGKLNTVEGFAMFKNTKLKTITGFNALKSAGKGGMVNKFYINDHQALTSISGFTALIEVKGGFGINECRKLTDMSALNLESVEGSITVSYTALTSLSGLGNVTDVGANVTMRHNTALTDYCALKPLFSLASFTGTFTVASNGTNPTKADVVANCP